MYLTLGRPGSFDGLSYRWHSGLSVGEEADNTPMHLTLSSSVHWTMLRSNVLTIAKVERCVPMHVTLVKIIKPPWVTLSVTQRFKI